MILCGRQWPRERHRTRWSGGGAVRPGVPPHTFPQLASKKARVPNLKCACHDNQLQLPSGNRKFQLWMKLNSLLSRIAQSSPLYAPAVTDKQTGIDRREAIDPPHRQVRIDGIIPCGSRLIGLYGFRCQKLVVYPRPLANRFQRCRAKSGS